MSLAALRSEFPILERVAYLNAGTDGPVPRAAQEAVAREIAAEVDDGRAHAHFERRFELMDALRSGYAELLGCTVDDLALATGTSEGLGKVLAGMEIGPGVEIVTSDRRAPRADRAADRRPAARRDDPRGAVRRARRRRRARAPRWSRARTSTGAPGRSRPRSWPSSACR